MFLWAVKKCETCWPQSNSNALTTLHTILNSVVRSLCPFTKAAFRTISLQRSTITWGQKPSWAIQCCPVCRKPREWEPFWLLQAGYSTEWQQWRKHLKGQLLVLPICKPTPVEGLAQVIQRSSRVSLLLRWVNLSWQSKGEGRKGPADMRNRAHEGPVGWM